MAQSSPILAVLLVAVVVGLLAGGRIRRLADVRVNWWGLAFAGVALQALPVPSSTGMNLNQLGTAMLLVSYLLLLVFLAANRWIPAASLMALGLTLNLAVVAANGGMPVGGRAIEEATGSRNVTLTVEGSPKHHLMTDGDVLAPLGDIIPVPPPASVVLSFGDILLYLGVAWFTIQVMRGRSRANPRPLALWFLTYRGKHAPDHWRMPARYRSTAPAGVGQSGT